MAEDKSVQTGFDEIAADIEAGRESGDDNKFWDCAEHLLGEMHKHRQMLEIAGEVEETRQPPGFMPMDPVERLKTRLHQLVFGIADLPDEEQQELFESFLEEIEIRMGRMTVETLVKLAQARLDQQTGPPTEP